MEVIVAGYNKTALDNLSPEIISASYARTSRDSRSIPEIREDAKLDIEKARKSNTNIVYGIGHSTIAEHVVFNIDIIGVSRFLVEEIESHRLTSYTEKSQRYALFNGDYTVPKELNEEDKKEFIRIIERQNKFYNESYPILLEYFKKENPEKYKSDPKTVEGWAKEDARYIISLATQTQLGMTISARNLELMIRRLKACPFEEHKELADKLYNSVYSITPSLFPYTEPTELEIRNKKRQFKKNVDHHFSENEDCELIFDNQSRDEILGSYIGYGYHNLDFLRGMKSFDSAPREFEMVDFRFDVKISASCFAQLKRHRMMTLLPSNYINTEDVIIPESIIKSKLKYKFLEIIEDTNSIIDKTPYVITNSHPRFVSFKINLREMYHFCRMRMDNHAQWEIRNLAFKMYDLAYRKCPIGMSLCCGKDKFDEVYDKIFTKK